MRRLNELVSFNPLEMRLPTKSVSADGPTNLDILLCTSATRAEPQLSCNNTWSPWESEVSSAASVCSPHPRVGSAQSSPAVTRLSSGSSAGITHGFAQRPTACAGELPGES